MKIDVLTIFPKMFDSPFAESIVMRAQKNKLVEINIHDLRKWTLDKHKSVDGAPYGGGAGMVMRVDIIDRAVKALSKTKLSATKSKRKKIILLDTKGKLYNQKMAEDLVKLDHLILIAGHYEGVDHRVHDYVANEVISIGEYVLSGGEIPAMTVIDSIVRLVPGALGNPESLIEESYGNNIKQEYPQYTRPCQYKNKKVPEVLLSGNHFEIKKWRKTYSKLGKPMGIK